MKKEKILTVIPFSGFYESIWSDNVENAVDAMDAMDGDSGPGGVTEVNWIATGNAISKQYVWEFRVSWNNAMGFDLPVEFDHLESPTEYNFSTDRIFATISRRGVARLKQIARSNMAALKKVLTKHCTPCSGYVPKYSDDPEDWIQKSRRDYDHNEIQVLIETALESEGVDVQELEEDIYGQVAASNFIVYK